jgi:hypothetical protein
LSAAGLTVVTLADIWGKLNAQDIADPVWIRHAAERNFAGVTADDDLRYSPHNKAALIETGLQVFCFPNGNLPWKTQADRMLTHIREMERLIAEVPGAWMAKMYADSVAIAWPPSLRSLL